MKSKLYHVKPDGLRMFETIATSPDMAYRGVCCFYDPDRKIAIHEAGSDICHVYTRKLDKNGNLLEVIEHMQ